jgi:hypothetical protein
MLHCIIRNLLSNKLICTQIGPIGYHTQILQIRHPKERRGRLLNTPALNSGDIGLKFRSGERLS